MIRRRTASADFSRLRNNRALPTPQTPVNPPHVPSPLKILVVEDNRDLALRAFLTAP